MSTSWLQIKQRKKPTINSKLREAITDVLPFDIDQDKADIILDVIFKTILKGVKRDGFVSIRDLGRFHKVELPERYMKFRRNLPGRGKFSKHSELRYIPKKIKIKFKPCTALRHSLKDVVKESGENENA